MLKQIFVSDKSFRSNYEKDLTENKQSLCDELGYHCRDRLNVRTRVFICTVYKPPSSDIILLFLFLLSQVCDTNVCEHASACTDICTPPYYHCTCLPLYFKGERCEQNSSK